MREMKDSGIAWIGDIPKEWSTNRLKSFVLSHFGGCWGEDAKGNNNDVLCIRIADFDFSTQSVKNTASTFRNYTDSQIEKCLLIDGDLIVEKSGGGDKTPVGRVVLYDKTKFPKALFANFSECLRLSSTVYNRYIAYQLKSLYYSVDMHFYFNQTTGIQNLDMPEYLNALMCVPPLREQQKIASYLDKKCTQIDRLIENQQKQIEKLKAYKQSLITETVTKGLNPDVPMKDSGVEWIGFYPRHWEYMPFGYILHERNEKNNPVISEERLSLSIELGVTLYSEKTTNLDRFKDDFTQYKIAREGDLVMNSMNMIVGATGVSKYFGCVSPVYYTFFDNEKDHTTAKFCEYIFRSKTMIRVLHSMGKGIYSIDRGDDKINTCRLKVPKVDLKSLHISIPPVEEQREIVSYLDKKCSQIDNLIAIKQKKIEKLQQYKKSVIYEYVTGKKEVRE